MDKIMIPLHDGSGFAEIGSLVKWAKLPLPDPDQEKCIQKHGAGPFTVLGGGSLLLYFIDQNEKHIKAKPDWLVPAKSLLTVILDKIAWEISRASTSCFAEHNIKLFGEIILSPDLTNAEKNQAVKWINEMSRSLSPSGDESSTRRYLEDLATKLQK